MRTETMAFDNAIQLPTGTRVSVLMVTKDGRREQVKLIKGWKDNHFLALFDEDDADFELSVDSTSASRGIRYTLRGNNKSFTHYADRRNNYFPIEVLEKNGPKLHFKSHAKGGLVTDGPAPEPMTKLEFEVEVENKAKGESIEFKGKEMIIEVKQVTVSSQENFHLKVGSLDTLESVKHRIQEKLSIPSDNQRLIFMGQQFDDQRTLEDLGVKNEATLYLLLRTKRGNYLLPPGVSVRGIKAPIAVTSNLIEGFKSGKNSKQVFITQSGFNCDKAYQISPFVIELRTTPKIIM